MFKKKNVCFKIKYIKKTNSPTHLFTENWSMPYAVFSWATQKRNPILDISSTITVWAWSLKLKDIIFKKYFIYEMGRGRETSISCPLAQPWHVPWPGIKLVTTFQFTGSKAWMWALAGGAQARAHLQVLCMIRLLLRNIPISLTPVSLPSSNYVSLSPLYLNCIISEKSVKEIWCLSLFICYS